MDGFTYEDSVYQLQNSISTFSTVLMYAFLFTLLLGIIGCKVIAIQMIVQVQLIYYSLVTISKPNPSFIGLINMKFIGGFYTQPTNLVQQQIPQIYSNLGFSSNFFANFNIMFTCFLLCPILSGIFYLMSRYTKTLRMNKRLHGYAKSCLYELLLYFSILNSSKVFISQLINLQWSQGQVGPIVCGFIMICLILLSVILLVMFRKQHKQFNDEYHEDIKCRIYIYILIGKVFICSIFLGLEYRINFSIYIILVIQVGFIIYVGVVRSQMQFHMYLRQLINLAATIIILVIIAYYGQASLTYTSSVTGTLYLPIVIQILLLGMLLLNLGFILKYIVVEYMIYWIEKIKENKQQQKNCQPVLLDAHVTLESPITRDPLETVEFKMMQTMKQHHSSYNSKKGLNLAQTIQRRDQNNADEMTKKLQQLNIYFN